DRVRYLQAGRNTPEAARCHAPQGAGLAADDPAADRPRGDRGLVPADRASGGGMTRALRVAGVGWTPGPGWETDHLVLAVLSRVTGRPIVRSSLARADLVLVGPFLNKVAGTVPRPLPLALLAE